MTLKVKDCLLKILSEGSHFHINSIICIEKIIWDRSFFVMGGSGDTAVNQTNNSSFIDLTYQREQHFTRNIMKISEISLTRKAKYFDLNLRLNICSPER